MPQTNSLFGPVFAVVAVAVVLVFVFVIVSIVRNAGRARQHGLDPLTMQTDMAAKVMNSDLLAAKRPLAERLAEVDALLAAGTISATEHATARAAILAAD